MRVDVYKAQRMTDRSEPTESLAIFATVEFPDFPTLEAAAKQHSEQGKALAEAIFKHLAGGTIDALIAEMLRRRASLFAVRFDA